MPKSLMRRLELLESRAPDEPRFHTDAQLLAWLEAVAAGDHPLGRTERFRAAWAQYVMARTQLQAAPEEPPPHYRRDEPESERRRMWVCWDDRSLNESICGILEVVTEWPS